MNPKLKKSKNFEAQLEVMHHYRKALVRPGVIFLSSSVYEDTDPAPTYQNSTVS